MSVVTHPETGLFPQPREIQLHCNCPDLCKHLAAVLYGVGTLLDKQPELLFSLRGVDHEALIDTEITLPTGSSKRRRLDSDIGDVFGIDVDVSDHRLAHQRDKKTATRNKPMPKNEAANSPHASRKASQSKRKKPFNPTSATVSRLRLRLR